MSSIVKHQLSNGVRILVEPVDYVQSAAVGLWCHTGSTAERDDEAGITHLIEHMLFKGTERRSAHDIAASIEGQGGYLNAFTDREQTCYYARVLAEDVQNAMDVLADMVLNSKIDSEELSREKKVVLEEIKRGEDEPSDHVHDLHLNLRWGGHVLGKSIIGTRESVSSFEREHLKHYMDRRYRGGNLVLSVAGNVDADKVIEFARQSLGDLPELEDHLDLGPVQAQSGYREIGRQEIESVHFCIGTSGPNKHDPNRFKAAVLDSVLGGGMSSRLFQEIREKRGLAYAVGSYLLSYTHGGSLVVFGGTSLETWPEVQEVIRGEFAKVAEGQVTEDELARIKKNIAGSMVLGLEGMSSRMMRMTRNELNYGREVPVEETLEHINAVTIEDLAILARDLFKDELLTTCAIGPFSRS